MKKRKKRRFPLVPLAMLALLAVLFVIVYPRMAARSQYPVRYEAEIRKAAEVYSLDPALLAAVARIESSYRADARSYVGALGLMQIMPETGAWIAGKFDESYVDGCLFDPETNIRYGCWYLGYLLRRYDGDKRCSTAAYHSGQGTVDGWLKDPEYSTDGRTLNIIGGPRANTYVGRVLEYYEKYTQLYANLEA